MTRSLCCCATLLAALLTAVSITPKVHAQAANAPGAPAETILESTPPDALPPSVDAPAPNVAAASPASVTAKETTVAVGHGSLDGLIAHHAAANNLPETLVRRVIKRESRGNPRVISKGNYGLMQIRLGTARALGYRGGAEGLLDPDTNMTYAVKYLAGAYHAAGGNQDRAVHYYAAGYYYAAKRQGLPAPGSHQPLNIIAINAVGSNNLAGTATDSQPNPAK